MVRFCIGKKKKMERDRKKCTREKEIGGKQKSEKKKESGVRKRVRWLFRSRGRFSLSRNGGGKKGRKDTPFEHEASEFRSDSNEVGSQLAHFVSFFNYQSARAA